MAALDTKDALEKLRHLPFDDMGFAKIDNHREIRTGFPEVIFCPGKTPEQILAIVKRMNENGSNVLASRMKKETAEFLSAHFPLGEYFETAGIFFVENNILLNLQKHFHKYISFIGTFHHIQFT